MEGGDDKRKTKKRIVNSVESHPHKHQVVLQPDLTGTKVERQTEKGEVRTEG